MINLSQSADKQVAVRLLIPASYNHTKNNWYAMKLFSNVYVYFTNVSRSEYRPLGLTH